MNNNLVSRFLEERNYDVRISGNGRWIDQKCAFDAVCFVADCIMDYIQSGGSQPFQSPNIWKSEYAITNVQNIFCKPDPLRRTTLDEYNKFFRQPMKMLAAAGVLREDGVVRNTIQFSVANMDILQYIALRERNAFDFLCLYIEKTLKDSGLWDSFETFFDEQTNDALQSLKDTFAAFCIKYTPINTAVEASRIFTKVLNPLACKYHKKGTAKGKISPSMITYAMPNSNTSYDELNIKYQTTILDSYQIVVLDGGRLQIPTPTWGYVCHDEYGLHHKYTYKYYVGGSKRYRILRFLYDPQNSDHRYAFMHLQDVVLFYRSDEERLAFEVYIEGHQNLLSDKISEITRFDHISTGSDRKTEVYKERLKTGVALNALLKEWRNTHDTK